MKNVKGMEFAKYYNGTKVLTQLINEAKVDSYKEGYCKGVYICSDTHDIWISRILEDMNTDYDTEKGTWLIERNKIDKYELIDFINENEPTDEKWEADSDYELNYILSNIPAENLIRHTILFDDDQGLENWDNLQCDSYSECIEAIDSGFGIVEL